MKKTLLLIFSSVLLLSGCQGGGVSKQSLNDYSISYSSESMFNEEIIASEFQEALSKKSHLELNIEAKEDFDSSDKTIYLQVDDTFDEGFYSIKKNKQSFIFTSDSNVGINEACHDFLNNCIRGKDNINSWYTSNYIKKYQKTDPVKVMSFNLRVADDGTLSNGDSGNISNRAPRIIKCIETHMPDSLGVQEASTTWVNKLKDGLMPQYGYAGWGRESSYTGEASGILFNRDVLTLLKSETKWLSETPDVPGSHFADYGGYNRIFTYAIFKRNYDDFIYMHINTHLDLNRNPRIEDVEAINNFVQDYIDIMPIFVTGDFNSEKTTDDAINHLLTEYNYVDAFDEVKGAEAHFTFPQDGYSKTLGILDDGETAVVDYCLKANKGIIFNKYLVDIEKYSGDGIERPQLTSDHYPIVLEGELYRPLLPFDYFEYGENDVDKNNAFSTYDHDFEFISTQSEHQYRKSYLAVDADHNGKERASSGANTQYNIVNSLNKTGGHITYTINAPEDMTVDLDMILSSSVNGITSDNFITKDLGAVVTLKINDEPININGIELRNTDIKQWYEWEQLVIRDIDLYQGVNEITMTSKSGVCPNQMMLDVYSDVRL